MSFSLKYLLAILILGSCINAHAESQKWEYLTKTVNLLSDSVMTQHLNKWGQQGWELVNCSTSDGQMICIFKRKA